MTWISQRALDRPRATLIVCAVLTLALGIGALRLELRTDGHALTPEGHPVVMRDAEDRVRFRDARKAILVALARSPEQTLATPHGFRFLRELHVRLERLDVLRSSGLVSLAGLPRLTRDGGTVSVGTYLDAIPEADDGFEAWLATLRSRPLVDGLLLARDGQSALFVLPLSEATSAAEAIGSLEAFAAGASTDEFELLLGGPLVAETNLGEQVLSDLALLVPGMVVVIAVLLFSMLGSPGGVLIPLIETAVVLIATFGAMGWAGAPIALVSTILPVVLMATCITDEVYLLERFGAQTGTGSPRARVEASLREVGRPIVLTSLTTALGFLSFTSASIGPLRDFGLFATFGILLAMLLSFTLIPALIVLLPVRIFEPASWRTGTIGQARLGAFAAGRPVVCFALAVAALALTVPGIRSLRVSDSWVENFDPESELVRADRQINRSFWGSYRLDVVLEAEPGRFHDPSGVALVERVCAVSENAPHVGGCESPYVALEELARVMDAATPLSALTADRLWDLFTLSELSEGRALDPSISASADAARVRLYVRSPDYGMARELMDHLEGELEPILSDTGVRHHLGGELAVTSALVESIVYDQLRSIGWALFTIALLLLAFTRRFRALLAVVPVSAASLGLFGVMGLAGITLGVATSMFASLAVGVGVDFGIHFLHRYDRERLAGSDFAAAIRATFDVTGRALLWNAIVLVAGFSVLIASSLKPNHSLGLLLVGATLACYGATLLGLPLLLRLGARGAAKKAAGLVACLWIAFAPTRAANAADLPCAGPPDPEATALMARLEQTRRGQARIARMQIETIYPKGHRLSASFAGKIDAKTLWAAANGDPDDTWLLFVFSGPGRMAGTTLLIEDRAGSEERDGTWLYLRAFDRFSRLEGRIERTVVPGSALSYEDAREYIAGAKYFFRSGGRAGENGVRVIGCPRTPALVDRLGYGALLIDVDPGRWLVLRIEYLGPGGGALKRYELIEAGSLDGREMPLRVKLVHVVDGFENDIRYEYWPVPTGLPADLFLPDMTRGSFLTRMRRVLHERGLGDRIDAEIREAEVSIRAYDERVR